MNSKPATIAAILFFIFFAWRLIAITSTDNPYDQTLASDQFIDMDGYKVSLDRYKGDYVWLDYAAEWCSYCVAQIRAIQSLEKRFDNEVLFITVIAGTDKVMEKPHIASAQQWISRFSLDPDKVLLKFSTNTLPYHVLYSPEGEILYQGSGLLNEEKITGLINKNRPSTERH